jgi:protease PrsW
MTARPHCCVCDRPIEGQVYTLGGRTYDAEHYRNVARENRATWGPLLVEIGAVVIFAALVAAIVGFGNLNLTGTTRLVAGVVLALVPAAIWLVAFYQQDRLEPEPKHYVIGVFVLGALLATAVGQPVIRDFFQVQNWLGANIIINILGSILIVGFVQEFLKYAAVRYTVFNSVEFDERVDGIIYGAAAGLGYATMTNLDYIVSNGGVDLGVGAIRVAVTALAHASFAGVTGYFLGRAKFENMGPFWLPLGLLLAATLNGIVTYVVGEVPTLTTSLENSDPNHWLGLVVAALVAGGTFAVLFAIIRRLNAATMAQVRAAS